jgi:hypothetical protein
MIPVDMTTIHAPPDSIGDCFPCCIASILEMPRSGVPHVYEGAGFLDETGRVGMARLCEWLKPQGLYYFEVAFDESMLVAWTEELDCHYVFGGISPRGTRHAPVGFKGTMVHDPHPSRGGITPDDGKYTLGFLVKR